MMLDLAEVRIVTNKLERRFARLLQNRLVAKKIGNDQINASVE